MRKRIWVVAGLLGLQFAANAAPAGEYEFYKVQTGESVEMIAVSRGLKADVLRQMNPALEHVVFPPEGTVIFVPPAPTAATPPRRVLSSRSGRLSPKLDMVASAAPVRVAPAPSRSSTHSGAGLSDGEVEAIFDEVAKPHIGNVAVSVAESLPLPSHQNILITSDGRQLSVPSARPRKKHVEKTSDEKTTVTSSRGLKVVRLLKSSLKYMGVPYVWGGEDPTGMDCSGFVQKVFVDHGISMPRTADLQYEVGQVVPRGAEQPGDLVFFETYCPGASHVGIYLGKQHFVHASSGAGMITIGDLRDEYFQRCYLGARRNW